MHSGKPTESSKILFVALHGFLGLPSDWDPIFKMLREQYPKATFEALDLLRKDKFGPENSFAKWTENFNSHIESKFADFPVKILLGYSMGGRLALHSLQRNQDLWTKVILLSTNPGLTTTEDRAAREKADAEWVDRFRHGKWEEVLTLWNAQPVFKDGIEPERWQQNYDRNLLAKALINWSHAVQPDFRTFTRMVEDKLLWFVGVDDTKYFNLMKEVGGQRIELTNHSHRLLGSPEVASHLTEEIRKILS